MNFNQLLIFHKVAELRHFTRAAEALYISQPAVSKQVHQLEKTLNQPLFTQVGQKIYLTEAGKLLYDYADRIFALSAEAESALGEMQQLERGRLTLGASTTIGTYLLPELLGRYKEQYPGIDLVVEIGNTEEIQQKLLVHRLEVGLVEGSVTHQELSEQVWRQDELVLIAPPTYLLPEGEQTIQQFLAQKPPVILREQGSGTRSVLEQALERYGVEPVHPIIELGSTEAIKRAVAAGLGVSFVSAHTIQFEVASGYLKQILLSNFSVRRSLLIVRLNEKCLSKAAQAFLHLIETTS
ncbi:MAG TPA: selenium metabolism-associated LysR family transcriptional regulator [Ktedonobacteraceae bacterium]|nr:selenium metabolism-associated LysR family transcriptional regulator [Ktedonobacteraceae bacterium]